MMKGKILPLRILTKLKNINHKTALQRLSLGWDVKRILA
jgi:hypothetical protein